MEQNGISNNKLIDSGCSSVFGYFHKALGAIYLVAFVPLFFQVQALIGNSGLQPAAALIKQSVNTDGLLLSFLRFPSLYHLYPSDQMLYAIIIIGCVSAVCLMVGYRSFTAALFAWFSFLSVTTVGGDFFVIIIDLFLSEVGFLSLFSTFWLTRYSYVPGLVRFAFLLLNFRLWFCMGVIKFYMPLEAWSQFTFFDHFFQAQPMPTPVAKLFHYSPSWLKYLAIAGLFAGEIIVPFLVFGNKVMRWISVFVFVLISALIQLTGNYGYFNVLSIVLALTILKDSDIKYSVLTAVEEKKTKALFFRWALYLQLTLQFAYCIYVFNPKPYSYQNHFNYLFTTRNIDNDILNVLIEPLRWTEYWRICNPYGVFKGIPSYHGELRFSGSYDGKRWDTYKFRYAPSSYSDYLGFYAPFYPRLDHLMFYETLSESNAKYNPLNKLYKDQKPWSCVFISKLFENDKQVTSLLGNNPFQDKAPPVFILVENYRLAFNDTTSKNWSGVKMDFEKILTRDSACNGAIIPYNLAMKSVY